MNERALRTFAAGARDLHLSLRMWSRCLLCYTRRRERASGRTEPSVRERQAELIDFYACYESLIEVLCSAAQLGPTPKMEDAYQGHRTSIGLRYSPIRKFVVAFLQSEPQDAGQSLVLWGRAADDFEVLFAAPSLAEFLKADDGSMISRISRTREALNLYGEHLRHLAAVAS